MKNVKADHMLKNFLSGREVARDIANAYLFNGRNVVKRCEEASEEETSYMNYGGYVVSSRRERDKVFKAYNKHNEFFYFAIEAQLINDRTMPYRNKDYDFRRYFRQYMHLSQKQRDNKLFYPIPVITITLYFGYEKWKSPRKLSEMIQSKWVLQSNCFNDFDAFVFDIKESDLNKFHHKDVKLLFGAFQKYYASNKNAEACRGYKLSYELMLTFVSVLKDERLIEIVQKNEEKKEVIDMCSLLKEWERDAINVGKAKGISIGETRGEKHGKVAMLLNLMTSRIGELSPQLILKIEKCQVDKLDRLSIYLVDAKSEEEVMNILSQ